MRSMDLRDAGQNQEDRSDTSGDTELDSDLVFKDHGCQSCDQDHQGKGLFPFGDIREISLVIENGIAVVCNIVVGEQPETDGCVEQDADCQDRETDNGIFEEAELHAEGLKCRLGDHVAGRADQGEVSTHRSCEYQGHQQSGALESGFCGNTDHDGDQNCCGSCVGENAAHQSDDHHDRYDETPLCLGKLCYDTADLVCHSCLEEGTADDEHGDKQNDVGINETREGSFDIEDFGDTEADTYDHRGQAERYFFCYEHHNGKSQKKQCYGGWTHVDSLPPQKNSLKSKCNIEG